MLAQKIISALVLGICLWAVLNPRLQTRTLGTLALSLLALRAASTLCS